MADATHINYALEHAGPRNLLAQILPGLALERGYTEFRSHEISSETTLAKLMEVFEGKKVASVRTSAPGPESERRWWVTRIIDLGDALVLLKLYSTYNWDISVLGRSVTVVDSIMAELIKALPQMKSEDPKVVPVNFWSRAPNGAAQSRVRRISVPPWDTVIGNYAEKARTELDALMNLWPPIEDNGRLLLWHGTPGTGKSYGIRSLAQAWQKWCNIHYIVDPEKFFGDANYMLQVILQGDDGGEVPCTTDGQSGCPKAAEDRSSYGGPQWNLLIMEDSDEFLTPDAKERTGQSLARLLNLTSGFIGQGLNVLVLITTNVEIKHIHGALQREGRCMANIEFGKLNEAEAAAWARKHDLPDDLEIAEQTVAKLYALTRNQSQLRTGSLKQPLGLVHTR